MNTIVKFMSITITLMVFIASCTKESPQSTISITGEYSDLLANSVSLYGWCNQKEEDGLSAIYGIQYSETDSNTEPEGVVADSKDMGNKFRCNVTGLSSNTKYYYRAFVFFNGIFIFGDVKTFTTPSIRATVTIESSEVKVGIATISGKLAIESEGTIAKSATLYYSSTAFTVDALKSGGTVEALTLGSSGEFSILLETLERETTYYCVVVSEVGDMEFCSAVISFTTTKPSCPSGAVDLGLAVCWATCNIGATKPEEYGGYFQWAGTQDVTSTSIYLDDNNCPYHTGSSSDTGWTKYIPSSQSSYWSGSGSPDNKTILDPEDDVAHVKMGGSWHIPTEEDWKELRYNCWCTWTTVNGIGGYRVTSRKSGYTDRSIFLPAAGFRSADELIGAGTNGYSYYCWSYWSSSLYTNYPDLAIAPNDFDTSGGINCYIRYEGLPIRPVAD